MSDALSVHLSALLYPCPSMWYSLTPDLYGSSPSIRCRTAYSSMVAASFCCNGSKPKQGWIVWKLSGCDRRERTVRSVLNGPSVPFYHNHSGICNISWALFSLRRFLGLSDQSNPLWLVNEFVPNLDKKCKLYLIFQLKHVTITKNVSKTVTISTNF